MQRQFEIEDPALAKADSPSPSEDDDSQSGPRTEGGLVTELKDNDVLMGRGAPSAEYQGNTRLRRIVLDRHRDYVKARKRKDKHRIAVEIIETVYASHGRFLRRVEDVEQLKAKGLEPNQTAWEEVKHTAELLSKVKQLLRDIGPEARDKRAARRQERKRVRDSRNGKDEGEDDIGKPSCRSTASEGMASSKSRKLDLAHKATLSRDQAPNNSLSEHQVAAFRTAVAGQPGQTDGRATFLTQALHSTSPGIPLMVSQIQGNMFSPSILAAASQRRPGQQLPPTLAGHSLFRPHLNVRHAGTMSHQLWGMPGQSPHSLLSSLHQEELALEILRQRQRQDTIAQLYDNSVWLANTTAEQELARLSMNRNSGTNSVLGAGSFQLPPSLLPPRPVSAARQFRQNTSPSGHSDSKHNESPPLSSSGKSKQGGV